MPGNVLIRVGCDTKIGPYVLSGGPLIFILFFFSQGLLHRLR